MRSPWAQLVDVERVALFPPPGPIEAEIAVPGSKSVTNRALLLAGFAGGPSRLVGILKSDDAYWAVAALKTLGIDVEVSGDTAVVAGGGPRVREATLQVGSAGTLARFLSAMLALTPGRWRIEASPQMQRRPIQPLLEALESLGATIHALKTPGRFPLLIEGRKLPGGEVRISGATSSQFVSALLMAAPLAQTPIEVIVEGGIVQADYVRITLETLAAFGIRAQASPDLTRITVFPGAYPGRDLALEADASSAAYFFALAAASGGRIRVTNLGQNTLQPDLEFVEVLGRMGARVTKTPDWVEVQGPPQPLKGGFTVSLRAMSDQTPTLAVLATFADAPIRISEVAHVRHHESDRIAVMAAELQKAGIKVLEHADGLTVEPGRPKPTLLDSHDDHRVAMSLALLALRAPGLAIRQPGTVSKTFPDYFGYLERLGFRLRLYTQRP